MKRLMDIIASLLALVLFAPLMLVIAAVIRCQMGSPILFCQRRPGHHATPFALYKFRTMRDGDEPDEERLTKFGAALRATSLDELPEFWNVLRGDMSLVGPRPLLTQYLEQYSADQARRHAVRPGITGLAQVNGRNDISWEEKLRLDVWYVDHHCFSLDAKILFATPMLVLSQHGVSKRGHVTTDTFTRSKL